MSLAKSPISTHILDTTRGAPAVGVDVSIFLYAFHGKIII